MKREDLEQFLKGYEEEVFRSAQEMRGEEMPSLTEALFSLFETTGNRLKYEDNYFYRRRFLAVFGMAVVLGKKEQDIRKLEQVIEEICGETCWALPAHVDRAKDPNWRYVVDLFASETGFALAEIRELCGDVLSTEIKDRIAEEIEKRIFHTFENAAVPYSEWENGKYNWNAVCSGSVGCAAMYLLKEQPERLERILARLQSSLTHYITGFTEDGICMEGVAYFTYGMTFYTAFARMLEEYTHGKVDLMAGEKMKKIMESQQKCFFPGGLSVSFSDGSSYEKFRVGLTSFMAKKDPEVRFPDMKLAAGLHTDSCYRWAGLYRDYLWVKEYLETAPECEEAEEVSGYVLPGAQWVFCYGAKKSAAAIIGGSNGVAHNHNDVGSFHYVVGDELFLTDLGAGEYTKEYFRDETRYTIFVNQSLSHNIPIINGHGQYPGKEFACSRFVSDGKGHTEIELAAAYGDKTLKEFLRNLDFNKEEGSLKVCDHFVFESENTEEKETAGSEDSTGITIEENLITQIRPQIKDGQILLIGKKNSCIIEAENTQAFRVISKNFSDHEGLKQTAYLLQWDVPLSGKTAESTFKITIL